MGVAALVLGIISVVVGFIPFCGTWAIIPAIVGLVLGIVDCVKKSKEGNPKGKAIAGIVCSAVAIVVIIAYYLLAGAAMKKAGRSLENAIENYDWNSVNWTVDNSIDEM